MSTFFLDLVNSVSKIGYSLLADALGFSVRPLALIYVSSPWKLPTIGTILDGGLLYGLLSTISTVLIASSIGVLLHGPEWLGRLVAMAFAADGLAQLPIIIWPAVGEAWRYPVSHTGMLVTTLQLRYGLPIAMGIKSHPDEYIQQRMLLLSFAVPLRYMSLVLVEPTGPSAFALYGISAILLVFVVTPKSFWQLIGKCLEKAAELAKYVFSSVYIALAYIWPRIQEVLCAILQHPLLVGVYRMIVVPMWEFLSPWLLPFAMLAVVYSCCLTLMEIGMHKHLASSPDGILSGISRLFGAATAAVSFLILVLHAAMRTCRREQPDPLECSLLASLLAAWSRVISFPWWLMCKLWEPICRYIMLPLFEVVVAVLSCLGRFACGMPLLSILCVLLFNFLLLKYLPQGLGSVLEHCSQLLWPIKAMSRAVLDMQAALAAGSATDSALAIVFIMAVQIGAYYAVACVLEAARAVRGERTGHVLSLEELNDLAVTMGDPRQCGRCGFGPVDHRGCSNLRTHHMEVSVRGGSRSSVSNACPRCDWFTGSLEDWPPWDGELQTVHGRAMFRQRVWCEVVVVIRASSKAFLFPYGLLLLGHWLKLPPSLSAFLAFSYLLPWAVENRRLAASINSPSAYRGTARRGRVPQAAPPSGGDDADCGAAGGGPLMPHITQSEALRNILAGSPASIFLAMGDICSVCLEQFSAEAAQAVSASESAAAACQELQRLEPPLVALRCGHPLHVECAEAAVSAGGARHVRCPLCREPVTLAGDATAVVFS